MPLCPKWLHLLLCVFLSSSLAELDSSPRQSHATTLRFYEKERRLVVLPLYNASQKPLLEHLSISLPKVLAGRLANLGYIRATWPKDHIRARISSGLWGEKHRRYYSRRGNFPREPNMPGRVELLVENHELPPQEVKQILETGLLPSAEKLETDYLLTGRLLALDARARQLRYEFELCDAISGRSFHFSVKAERSRAYVPVPRLVSKIEAIFLGKNTVRLSLESTMPGAMAYLDNVYLGRTPLIRKVLAGHYRLRLVQEDYHSLTKEIVLHSDRKNHFYIANKPKTGRASLQVESEPSGAAVYLNVQYIGQTPLKRVDLLEGSHRLHLVKEGYIDRYIGVQLKAGEPQNIKAKMQKGDTLAYYRDMQYAIGTWTYFDLARYSGLATVGFYGSWLFFDTQGQRIRNGDDADSTASETRAERNFQYARISAGLGVLALLSTAYFLYRGVELSQSREFGEISFIYNNSTLSRGRRFQFSPPLYMEEFSIHLRARF